MCRDGDGTNGEDVTNSRDSSGGRAEFQHKEYQRELHHPGDLFQEENQAEESFHQTSPKSSLTKALLPPSKKSSSSNKKINQS